jgi:hypothetical protein
MVDEEEETKIPFKAKAARFFKRTWVVWGLLFVFACCCLGDYIHYRMFDLTCLSYQNQSDQTSALYYSTPDLDEKIHITVYLTHRGEPVSGHSLVGIGKKGGQIAVPRLVSDTEGKAIFEYVPNPQYRSPESVDGQVYVYDESTAIIVEFRLERYFDFTMVKPAGDNG